jgi:hypothetical protein
VPGNNPFGLDDLVQTLGERRRAIISIYAAFVLAFLAFCFRYGLGATPKALILLFKACPMTLNRESDKSPVVIFALIFLGSQVLFLFGGGRLRNGDQPVRTKHLIVPAMIATPFLGLIVAAGVFNSIELVDRTSGPRNVELLGIFSLNGDRLEHFFDDAPKRAALGIAFGLLVATGLILFARRRSRSAALLRLSMLVLVVGWIVLSLSLPAELAVCGHTDGSFLDVLTGSYLALLASVVVFVWALGPAIYLLRYVAPRLHETAPSEPLKGGPYIASARTLALLLSVIAYFGYTQATAHATRLDYVIAARQAFSEDLVRRYTNGLTEFQGWLASPASGDLDTTFEWLRQYLKESYPEPIPWARSVKVKAAGVRNPSLLDSFSRGIRFAVEVEEYSDDRKWTSWVTVNFFSLYHFVNPTQESQSPTGVAATGGRLWTIAVRGGFKPEREEDFIALYPRLESDLLAKEITLPTSGFSFRVSQVVWVCTLVAFVLLLLIRDRVRNVFRDPELGWGEPWLVLDARGWIGRRLAQLWIAGLFAGPWLITVATTRVAALSLRANGSISDLWQDLALTLLLSAMVILSGWASLAATSDILRLRRLQRDRRVA